MKMIEEGKSMSVFDTDEYIPTDKEHYKSLIVNAKPYDYTDLGQTQAFYRYFSPIIKYTTATNFLYYDGRKWIESDTEIHKLIQEFTDIQLEQALSQLQRAQQIENDSALNKDKENNKKANKLIKEAKNYRAHVLNSRNTLRINAVLTELKPMVEIDISKFDENGLLLNTPYGTIELDKAEIRENDSEDYCTKTTGCVLSDENYDLFLDFIDTITCGNNELAKYLQLIAGMFAVGEVYCENLVIAYGSGRNGKSTFFNLLSKVLGDYSGCISAETLTTNCRKNKSPEYAELKGKRLVIAAELEEGVRLDTAIVKKICSTDLIYAEKKYKAPFSFKPSHTVVLFTNHLPNVGTTDTGTWRRLIVIPFNAVIEKNDDIKNYADYLFKEAGGAVLNWIVSGAYKFIQSGCKIETPQIVEEAIENYRKANDWLNNYITECCEVDNSYIQSSSELYENYRQYCSRNGEYIRNSSNFKEALENAGYTYTRKNTGRFWCGLKIAEPKTEMKMPYITRITSNHSSDYKVTESDSKIQNSYNDDFVEF